VKSLSPRINILNGEKLDAYIVDEIMNQELQPVTNLEITQFSTKLKRSNVISQQ